MRQRLAVLAVSVVVVTAPPALACLPARQQAPNTPADDAALAGAMVRQAAYVEIVEVQDETPIPGPKLWRQWLELQGAHYKAPQHPKIQQWIERPYEERRNTPAGTRYALRVAKRLKGSGPDVIHLNGGFPLVAAAMDDVSGRKPADQPGPPLNHWADMLDGAPFTFNMPNELVAHNLLPETSCDPEAIRFRRGVRYPIFRGSDGHLLGPVAFNGAGKPTLGYRVVQISPRGPQNWLAAVEVAAGGGRSPRRPVVR